MPRFSANLSTLFTEVDFPDRFERAAKAGFGAVEIQFPYAWEVELLSEKLMQFNLKLVLHNMPPGKWDQGERGIATLPDRVAEFQDTVRQAIRYAKALKCPCLNCLVGLTPAGISAEEVRRTLTDNLRFAADALHREDIQLVAEMLNSRDVPGFYLNNTKEAIKLIEEINHPNLRMQYDVYHMQIMEGDLTRTIQDHIDQIGHIQIADNPGRHQPGTGEINFSNLIRFIDAAGYRGWIGCEYLPTGRTEDTLDFLHAMK